MTDYDYYVLGCRHEGKEPISKWRFSVAYGKYCREFSKAMARQLGDVAKREQRNLIIYWEHLAKIAKRVAKGREIFETARRQGRGDWDDLGDAGSSDREPATPRHPVLAGSDARPLPSKEDSSSPAWLYS